MARFFGGLGGKGSGGGSKFAGMKTSSGKTSSSLEQAMNAQSAMEKLKKGNVGKHSKGGKQTAEERYEQLMQQKMESNKKALMAGGRNNNTLAGKTKENDQKSAAKALTMELLAAQMAKKQLKRKKKNEPVEVKYMPLGGANGGSIDKKGRILNAYGQQVLQIDLKTGKIKTIGMFGGTSIGKFDPKSTYCIYKIQKKIEDFNIKKGYGATNVWGAQATNKPMGGAVDSNPWSIYGTNPGDE